MNIKLLNFKKNFLYVLSLLPPEIQHIMSQNENYFVGGFVRDTYINKENNYDIDIVVNDIDNVLFLLKKKLKANIITLDESFGV